MRAGSTPSPESGIRACIAPMYRDARWFTRDGHSLEYAWDTTRGREAFENAARLVERARQHRCGRLSGMLCPAQIDTCSPELIRDSHALARERGLELHIHVAQSVAEFHEMYRRHGMTPVQWLDSLGVLDGARSSATRSSSTTIPGCTGPRGATST